MSDQPVAYAWALDQRTILHLLAYLNDAADTLSSRVRCQVEQDHAQRKICRAGDFTNTVKRVVRIELDDLLKPEGLAQLRAVFFDPKTFRAPRTTEQVTQAAASEFARLADLLRERGAEPHQAAHFLIRLLFCLFAEDIGLYNDRMALGRPGVGKVQVAFLRRKWFNLTSGHL